MRQKPPTGDVKVNHISKAGWLYHSIPKRERESEQKTSPNFVTNAEPRRTP